MPPADEQPSSLFSKLLEMPRPTEVIDFPRNDEQGNPVARVRVQVLTSVEHDQARKLAYAALKKEGYDAADLSSPAIREVLGDAIAKELIAMACLSEQDYGDPGKPLYKREFRNSADLNKVGIRADELAVLFSAYEMTQNKYGPFERNLSAADVDAWIARLGEGAAEFPLLRLALPQLVLLAQSLGERLFTLYRTLASQRGKLPSSLESLLPDSFTDIGSAGSPADESDPTTSERSDRPLTPITAETATDIARRMRGE